MLMCFPSFEIFDRILRTLLRYYWNCTYRKGLILAINNKRQTVLLIWI